MIQLQFNPFPLLETSRLQLRELNESDQYDMYVLRSDAQVLTYQDRKQAQSVDEAAAFIGKIQEGISNNDWIMWAIAKKENDRLIGTVCLWNISEEEACADIGFELLPSEQRAGLMHEAVTAVIDYGFQAMELRSIVAFTHTENAASIRLLEKQLFKKDVRFPCEPHEVAYLLEANR
ncbi:GNAT family N-acetyltransferase [Paenibacillus sp. 1011MAR3C5]|uniref:GNAT family N-acetyltransferase n=1 Tax=Paenibacillus sp. 1011MAR3C5 TaxID=1675787 RepID=UPI0016015FF7|nr:GNAT family N-acetyltransferase [Paenibacillus sp. 1011MAR3C5]